MEENKSLAEQPKPRFEVTYKSGGQEVKLNEALVRNYLAKGNSQITDADIVQFISICKYNELNPFLGEAYLVKYGSTPAQMVVSKEAYLKRADSNQQYEGLKAGIIVRKEVSREGDRIIFGTENREGCFINAGEELVGGWAEVYRKDKKFPYFQSVSFKEYDKGQSLWKEKPSTMIRKVAIVQALREAFPSQLNALYISEETSVRVEDAESVEIPVDANTEQIVIPTEEHAEEVKAAPEEKEQPKPAKEKQKEPKPMGATETPELFK